MLQKTYKGVMDLKNGLTKKADEIMAGVGAAMIAAGVSPVYCTNATNVNTAASKVLKMIFNVLLFGGLIMTAVGVVSLVKAVQAGDSAAPGSIGKATGMLLGGVIMCAAKYLVEQLLGVTIDSFTLI